jgi:mRNA-degrading endonuclease RelE of RelBE toxin-antitoxin system
MTVVETERFLKDAQPLMPESERGELVAFVAANPEAGKVIPETGGVRKLRWGLPGRGKRGGARVIYYYHSERPPVE